MSQRHEVLLNFDPDSLGGDGPTWTDEMLTALETGEMCKDVFGEASKTLEEGLEL